MNNKFRQYWTNWWLFLHFHWLWTRNAKRDIAAELAPDYYIRYKPGWGPWKFLPVYLTTYLLGTLAGHGVVSLSRVWYERSELCGHEYDRNGEKELCKHWPVNHPILMFDGHKFAPRHPFARFMTRLLNWLVPGKHGALTGGRLWGSKSIRG